MLFLLPVTGIFTLTGAVTKPVVVQLSSPCSYTVTHSLGHQFCRNKRNERFFWVFLQLH